MLEWSQQQYARPNFIPDYQGNGGPVNPLPPGSTAIQYFNKFIDDDMLMQWVDDTHMYAEVRQLCDKLYSNIICGDSFET